MAPRASQSATRRHLLRPRLEPNLSAMTLTLSDHDRSLLAGDEGEAAASAMKILVALAEATGARGFLDISQAHIDGCIYHGKANLDFVESFVARAGRVRVPTTLNVGSLDLIHPELIRMTDEEKTPAKRLMAAHEALGCVPSFTCAPYQMLLRPRFGDQVAWGESNAIVFANSVIGARTNRYGDFTDLCCAITGRAPASGLHLAENRLGRLLFKLEGFPDSLEATDELYVAIGLIIGAGSGDRVPVVEGLPRPRDEDQLKGLGAAAASTGEVGLFHIPGVTPEAPTLAAAFGGRPPEATILVTPDDVERALASLSNAPDGAPLAAVCLGTPHFSRREWDRLLALLQNDAQRGAPIYVNTSRDILLRLENEGLSASFDRFNIISVVDTCTYVTAILARSDGVVMTNSGKWAYYAPGNLGVSVAFGSLADCLASAAAGRVTRGRR
jgi:predicted aconitase